MRNERGAWNFGLNAYWSRQTVCVEGGGGRGFHSKRGNQYSPCPRIDVKYFLILALITCIRTGLTITITENGRVIGSARAHPSPSPLFFFFVQRAFNVYDQGPFIRAPIILLVHSSRRRMNIHRVDRHDSISQRYKRASIRALFIYYSSRYTNIIILAE